MMNVSPVVNAGNTTEFDSVTAAAPAVLDGGVGVGLEPFQVEAIRSTRQRVALHLGSPVLTTSVRPLFV